MTETATLTLSEFLLARIAEDEATYRGAMHIGCVEDDSDGPDVIHSARCPNRILAECAAKRRIVEGMEPYGRIDDINAPEVLGLLAQPYAEHPDFREEWAV